MKVSITICLRSEMINSDLQELMKLKPVQIQWKLKELFWKFSTLSLNIAPLGNDLFCTRCTLVFSQRKNQSNLKKYRSLDLIKQHQLKLICFSGYQSIKLMTRHLVRLQMVYNRHLLNIACVSQRMGYSEVECCKSCLEKEETDIYYFLCEYPNIQGCRPQFLGIQRKLDRLIDVMIDGNTSSLAPSHIPSNRSIACFRKRVDRFARSRNYPASWHCGEGWELFSTTFKKTTISFLHNRSQFEREIELWESHL